MVSSVRATSSASRTSRWTASTFPPTSSASARERGSSRAATTTVAPTSARLRTQVSPRPRLPPVTTATLPLRSKRSSTLTGTSSSESARHRVEFRAIVEEPQAAAARQAPRDARSEVRFEEREVARSEPVARRGRLVPERVEQRQRAQALEPCALVILQPQVGGPEVVCELLVGARADDDRRHARASEQPGERDLRRGDAACAGDLDECVDDVVELLLVADGRLVPLGQLPGAGRTLLAAAVLSGEQAAGERAPHEDPDTLVDGRG